MKQAPRAWFQRMCTFLFSVGCIQSIFDSSLFIYLWSWDAPNIVLLYVDGIVVTSRSDQLLQMFIERLGREFDIRI